MSSCIRVGVIVVSWESCAVTLKCLQSLQALNLQDEYLDIDLQVILCENGSSDEIVQQLGNWLELQGDTRLTLLQTGVNGGYAYGVNAGIRQLLEKNVPEYLWILNNDVEVERESLLALVAVAQARADILIWGSTIVRSEGRETLECAGGYTYSPLTTRVKACHAGRSLVESADLPVPRMDYICGAAMFCRSNLFQRFGLLEEDYFLYYEEQDLVRRLPRPAPIDWCPASIVYHRGGDSTSQAKLHRSPLQQYYENLSTLKFTARFFRAYLPLVFAVRLVLKPVLFLLRAEWHLYRPFFAAYRDFIFQSKVRNSPGRS